MRRSGESQRREASLESPARTACTSSERASLEGGEKLFEGLQHSRNEVVSEVEKMRSGLTDPGSVTWHGDL
jgi:hypothetical protein